MDETVFVVVRGAAFNDRAIAAYRDKAQAGRHADLATREWGKILREMLEGGPRRYNPFDPELHIVASPKVDDAARYHVDEVPLREVAGALPR